VTFPASSYPYAPRDYNHAEVARKSDRHHIERYAEGRKAAAMLELPAVRCLASGDAESVKTDWGERRAAQHQGAGSCARGPRRRGLEPWNMFDADVLAWHLDAASTAASCAISPASGLQVEPRAEALAARAAPRSSRYRHLYRSIAKHGAASIAFPSGSPNAAAAHCTLRGATRLRQSVHDVPSRVIEAAHERPLPA